MLVKLCLLIVLSAVVMAAPTNSAPKEEHLSVEEHWAKFKTDHGKNYATPEEEAKRFAIFKDNFKKIEEHNKKYEAGEVTYTQGINQFADLTTEEFSQTYLMHLPKDHHAGLKGLSGVH